MECAIESLPNELMDNIIGHVDHIEISRLMQCNSSLKKRLEPQFYSSDEARNKAMFWACTHNQTTVIRTLVTNYASSASTVDLPSIYYPYRVRVLTLNLVVRKSLSEAFNLLLELGALVNNCNIGVSQYQPWFLLRRLCRPSKWKLLTRLLDVVESSQNYLLKRQLDQTLILLIKFKAPLDLVKRVLDLGADPDSPHAIHSYPSHSLVCPLSAAILHHSHTLFSLLLERGATIHGTDLRTTTRTPLHIPIFAAAHALPRYGPNMMRNCLENGADINHRARVTARNFWYNYSTTPVDVFLRSIKSSSSTNDSDRFAPEEGLQFMLDNGATLEREPADLELYYVGEERFVRRPSSIQILIKKRKPRQIANPYFVAVIDILLKYGALEKQDNSVAARILKNARRGIPGDERGFLECLITMIGEDNRPRPVFL